MSIKEKYTYEGLGFPLELRNVEMVEVKNYELPLKTELRPLINVREVSDQAIQILVAQSTQFTGNQIGFIRAYFKMGENELAQALNKKFEDVKKWEQTETKPAGMDVASENLLKQFIRNALASKLQTGNEIKIIKENNSPGALVAKTGLFGPASKESKQPLIKDEPASPRKKPKN